VDRLAGRTVTPPLHFLWATRYARSTRALVADMTRNPKRYINVRVF